MPQEMLAEDKHWSHWYLFSSYLTAQNTHPHTNTHLGNMHSYTHSIHDFMQVFMSLLMHTCGCKKHSRAETILAFTYLLIAGNSIEYECKTGHFTSTNKKMLKNTHTRTGS